MSCSPFGLKLAGWVSVGSLLASVACSDDNDPTKGTGGAASVGGGTAIGGSSARNTGGTKSSVGGAGTSANAGGSATGGQSAVTAGGTSSLVSGGASGVHTGGTVGAGGVHTGGTAGSSSVQTGGSGVAGGAAAGGFAGTGGVAACGTAVGLNVLTGADFETGTAHGATIPGWSKDGATQADLDASFLEYQNAHTGFGRLTNWATTAYTVTTYQQVTSIPNGTYMLSVWMLRGTGFNSQYLFASGYSATDSAAKVTVDTSSASSTVYTQIVLDGIQVTNGTCEVGIYSDAPAGGMWANFDDFSLVRVGGVGCIEATGGASGTGGSSAVAAGGQSSVGGATGQGGVAATGGSGVGGDAGGSGATGGDTSITGGSQSTGGSPSTGGSLATGGTASTGGTTSAVAPTNLLNNPGLEDGNASSSTVSSWVQSGDTSASFVKWGYAHSGNLQLALWSANAYLATVSQSVSSLANGTYTFSAWVARGGTFNSLYLFAKNYKASSPSDSLQAITDSAGSSYTQIVLPGIPVTNGQCEVGIYADAQTGAWANLDDFSFTMDP